MTLRFGISSLYLSGADIAAVYHHTWFIQCFCQTQSLMHTRWVLCQLSSIPSSCVLNMCIFSFFPSPVALRSKVYSQLELEEFNFGLENKIGH